MSEFKYSVASSVPFRDRRAIQRVLNMSGEKFGRHRNPRFRIRVMADDELEYRWIVDLFNRIKEASEFDRPLVILTPGPCAAFVRVAHLINEFHVSCRRIHLFQPFEFANEAGETAPADWPLGVLFQFKRLFYNAIQPGLRPPERQIQAPRSKSLADYGQRIADLGGADICYLSIGCTGGFAGVEAGGSEFGSKALKEWMSIGPRICTMSPYMLAQHALSPAFGCSADLTAVPPKVASIGPAEVVGAKSRISLNSSRFSGLASAVQRFVSRLAIHGPVTPQIPASVLQLLETDCWVGESIAAGAPLPASPEPVRQGNGRKRS